MTMLSSAKLKYYGVSAQKTRLVVDQVRGKPVGDALTILHYSRKRVARDLEKLMRSALSNAQQKDPGLDVDRLYVSWATVDEAPPMKRSRHRGMGRVYRVLKRACHVRFDLNLAGKAAAPAARQE
jgi:large subunit ribosomal protein L22